MLAIDRPQHAFDSKKLTRVMRLVRRHRPVLKLGPSLAVVIRREDVLRVLEDHESFGLPYADRLPGPCVLSLDGEDYLRHRAALRSVLRPDDRDRLLRIAGGHARMRVEVAGRGALDLGPDLVHPVMEDVVAEYMGLPGPAGRPDVMLQWGRALFENIFLNDMELAPVKSDAASAAAEMSAYVDGLMTARRADPPEASPDDVLGRLLKHQRDSGDAGLDDEEIRSNLMALAIGWLWHGARSALVAVDELLDAPDRLAQARAAATEGDMHRLQKVLWETLRFRAVQVGVPRKCLRDVTIGVGTPREAHLTVGDRVVAATHAAMWDDATVPDADDFDATRADQQYLIFGHGYHRCVGEDIMKAQLPAMLAPVLACGGLHRTPGRDGRLRWAGPTPDGLSVELAG